MYRYLVVVLTILMGILMGTAYSDEVHVSISNPGYRPPSEANLEKLFLERLGNMEITVFPTVARSFSSTKYDESSTEMICTFFKNKNIAKAQKSEQKIDLSESTANIQWDVFQKSMLLFAGHLEANPVKTEYALLVEFLITPNRTGGETIGGIQCYVLDTNGRNVFSFLLNSHHKLFTDGQLVTNDMTTEGRAELIKKGTEVVIEVLRLQLDF